MAACFLKADRLPAGGVAPGLRPHDRYEENHLISVKGVGLAPVTRCAEKASHILSRGRRAQGISSPSKN